MDANWNDSQPIYRQLRDRVVAMILEGELKEGDPLPSVRSVASEYRLNPLTVLKGYQQLVDEWPKVHATITRLGFKPEELLSQQPAPRPAAGSLSTRKEDDNDSAE